MSCDSLLPFEEQGVGVLIIQGFVFLDQAAVEVARLLGVNMFDVWSTEIQSVHCSLSGSRCNASTLDFFCFFCFVFFFF